MVVRADLPLRGGKSHRPCAFGAVGWLGRGKPATPADSPGPRSTVGRARSPSAHFPGRNSSRALGTLRSPRNKNPVLPDRPANRSAELIEREAGLLGHLLEPRVESAVLVVFKQAAMPPFVPDWETRFTWPPMASSYSAGNNAFHRADFLDAFHAHQIHQVAALVPPGLLLPELPLASFRRANTPCHCGRCRSCSPRFHRFPGRRDAGLIRSMPLKFRFWRGSSRTSLTL